MVEGRFCILIADDEPEIRDVLRLLLEGEGYEVREAKDGNEADQYRTNLRILRDRFYYSCN